MAVHRVCAPLGQWLITDITSVTEVIKSYSQVIWKLLLHFCLKQWHDCVRRHLLTQFVLRYIQRHVLLCAQERKKAVKDLQREKRKTKVPKYQKKRREKLAKMKKH